MTRYEKVKKIMDKSKQTADKQVQTLINAFYLRLLDAYGYTPEQLDRNVAIGTSTCVDIAIWRTAEAKKEGSLPDICVVVVCRLEYIRIDATEFLPAIAEMQNKHDFFFVCHNMRETRVFYCNKSHSWKMEQFADFPKAADVVREDIWNAFVKRMRQNSKDTLLQAFSRSHNIIRNNDKMSPESAFDEISKIIFIKMLYERKPDSELVYTREKYLRDEQRWSINHRDGDYCKALFDEVKVQYSSDGIFETGETIRIKRESFLKILDEFASVSLYGIAEDVKGVAFESFLGRTFRGELGQFFTPRSIVEFMVDVLDVHEGELVCDPCCGSGGFLIRAFEKVQDDIERDLNKQINSLQKHTLTSLTNIDTLLKELDKTRSGSRFHRLCHDYLFGVDANMRMARTAKMNMIMHGDGHVGVYLHDGLLDIGKVVEGAFDVILINPPFGVHIDRTQKNETGKSIDDMYELSSSNAEFLFIERCLRLLKPGGRAGLVLPEGLFNNKQASFARVREYVSSHARILGIVSIPADVFLASGANIKPSLLFIRKFSGVERESFTNHSNVAIMACEVNDAGINSLGLPSNNNELKNLVEPLRDWITKNTVPPTHDKIRMVLVDDMEDWNIHPFFSKRPVVFRKNMPTIRLSEVLIPVHNWTILENDTLYMRITVKLFNNGIVLRDRVHGVEVGTKRQNIAHAGQLIVSKIDGKSGAFGFLPKELDGAIVTQDFPVFSVNESLAVPEYIEQVLVHPCMLDQIKVTSSGSTGRKRLSVSKFLNLEVPLPSLEEQKRCVAKILEIRCKQKELDEALETEISKFNSTVFA